jgi:hypothetical protein
MGDCGKCQTSAASPAEPGDLRYWASGQAGAARLRLTSLKLIDDFKPPAIVFWRRS